jgi:putative membrane protein
MIKKEEIMDKIYKCQSSLVCVVKGFIMGASDIVPGVSGGTMALVLGIYERLVYAIRGVLDKKNIKLLYKLRFKELLGNIEIKFLLPLVFGILLAIVTLSRPLEWLLNNKPNHLMAFFFGLVLASIFFVRRKITKWPLRIWGIFFVGMLVGYLITGIIPVETPEIPILFFVSGAIAISAMVLPGISGSFLLLIMGKYEQILSAVNNKDFFTIGIFLLGIIVGLALFIRVLSWLLKHYHDITFSFLIGLMVGSLRKVWPWKLNGYNVWPSDFTSENVIYFLLAVLGFSIVLIILRLNYRMEVQRVEKKEERLKEKKEGEDMKKIYE